MMDHLIELAALGFPRFLLSAQFSCQAIQRRKRTLCFLPDFLERTHEWHIGTVFALMALLLILQDALLEAQCILFLACFCTGLITGTLQCMQFPAQLLFARCSPLWINHCLIQFGLRAGAHITQFLLQASLIFLCLHDLLFQARTAVVKPFHAALQAASCLCQCLIRPVAHRNHFFILYILPVRHPAQSLGARLRTRLIAEEFCLAVAEFFFLPRQDLSLFRQIIDLLQQAAIGGQDILMLLHELPITHKLHQAVLEMFLLNLRFAALLAESLFILAALTLHLAVCLQLAQRLLLRLLQDTVCVLLLLIHLKRIIRTTSRTAGAPSIRAHSLGAPHRPALLLRASRTAIPGRKRSP